MRFLETIVFDSPCGAAAPRLREEKEKEMIVYMKVTRDEYELPLAIADTAGELAKMTGATEGAIWSSISHQKNGRVKRGSFKAVEIGEIEEWQNRDCGNN